MEKFINRPEYISFLERHANKPLIKVVSGVRRSGKSTLFKIFQEKLINQGIEENQVIAINFEDMAFQDLLDYKSLYQYIIERLHSDKMTYIFLDEIQWVDSFERVVDSLLLKDTVDIYITGSNAYFLSDELATLLTGRYVQLDILPLSFKEFVGAQKEPVSLQEHYNQYIKSSFPYTVNINDDQERFEYLQGIYSTIILNDIVKRLGIQDVELLERIIATLFSSIGSLVTINKIKNTLNSQGYKIAHQTIDRYISGGKSALVLYSAQRFNIHGRKLLENQSKYYVVDMGLRQFVLRDHLEDFGHILENIIFLELKRRNYTVYVGQSHQREVDFVAVKPDKSVEYYQVALTTLDEDVLRRELASLQTINDQYPKYLLTLDTLNPHANYDGIIKMNALDWLMA